MESALHVAIPLVFLALASIFLVFSIVLEHHWRRYSTKKQVVHQFRVVYYAVSGTLLFGMAIFGFLIFL